MEIVNSNSATLSNYEVMKQLHKIKDSKKKQKGQLATITYETLRYLENTPSSEQTPDTITNYLKELERFKLNKNEKLMITNFPPTTPLEIQLILEGSEERFTESQVEEILQLVAKHFPHVIKPEPVEEEEAE